MPELTLGPFTRQEANDGIPFGKFGGSVGPQTIVIFAYAENVEPPDAEFASIQEFPGNKFVVGAADGSMVVTATLINSGNDKSYFVVGAGSITVFNGMFAEKIRSLVTVDNPETVICSFTVQYAGYDLNDFTGPPLIETASPPEITETNYDPETETGNNTFTFTYENALAENPNSFAIRRTGPTTDIVNDIGSLVRVDGQTDYEFTDYSINEPGIYTYTIIPYTHSTLSVGPESNPSGPTPDVVSTMGFSSAEDLESDIFMLSDPSGIYTIVKDKRHDTLYERTGVTSINMAIPKPFGTTGFIP